MPGLFTAAAVWPPQLSPSWLWTDVIQQLHLIAWNLLASNWKGGWETYCFRQMNFHPRLATRKRHEYWAGSCQSLSHPTLLSTQHPYILFFSNRSRAILPKGDSAKVLFWSFRLNQVLKSLSLVQLFATPWTLQPMQFSRPEYWSG